MKRTDQGLSLVELLVGASILSIFIVSLVVVFQNLLVRSFNSVERVQASYLLEEGIEAVKALRDENWDENIDGLTFGDTYYLDYVSGLWIPVSSQPEFIDGVFDRSFILEAVERDGNDVITDSGTVDPNTVKVSVFVSWAQGTATTTRTLETYITNFHE